MNLVPAAEYLYIDVIRYYDDNCKPYEDGDPTLMSYTALGYTFLIWVIVYFCVFKGVKSSSYIVWLTVPLPIAFIIAMIIGNSTLDGAKEGVK